MGDSTSFESTQARYDATLNQALSNFRSLLSSHSSRHWKPVTLPQTAASNSASTSSSSSSNDKGKSKELLNGIGAVDLAGVQVHKRSSKGADVVRAMAEFPVGEGADVESFKAVLMTPEVRATWDKMVEHARDVELIDSSTRITKTDYRLGWPASPRDTITISKTFSDSTTLVDISTSLPRSPDEPSFLRPAPPYVRSHVHLLAFSLQLLPPSSTSTTPTKARITVFWQWSLKGAVFSTHHTHLSSLLSSLVSLVRSSGDLLPLVTGYGKSLEVSSRNWEKEQDCLTVDYVVLPDEEETASTKTGVEELERKRERKRLERAIEVDLAVGHGWDVRLIVKGVGEGVGTSYTVDAEMQKGANRTVVRVTHTKILKAEHVVRVSLVIQRLAGGKGVRVNGEQKKIVEIEPRDPSHLSRALLEDNASIATANTTASSSSNSPSTVASAPASSSPVQNEIMSLLRRNYIYFTSLLQEPEAKWRHVSDSHGVTVTQLNSIDPTLTIYRAEATFVGVGVWDVFSTICTPGARMQWDKTLEEATLLADVNELSSLWWTKTKASWPVAPRDSVTVRTAYKSPSSVHIFSFSTDDHTLFPAIPQLSPPTIRTQTDLYGWAIEALSPTTTQITLLDQSDPKGWSNKSWTPTSMVNAVSGVGDFSIKFGGPPVVTRLLGAKATMSRYEHDKGVLKTEYKAAKVGISTLSMDIVAGETDVSLGPIAPTEEEALVASTSSGTTLTESTTIECEIRCDVNTWASSIDVVIDPPPSRVSCLSRHRLSSGGGLWITIEHDSAMVEKDRILVVVRRGSSSREKGSVVVNGAKVAVDAELLPEDEVKLLTKRKRIKASPIPLDQYSTHGPRGWASPPSRSGSPSGVPSPLATTPPSSWPFGASEEPLKSSLSLPVTSSPLTKRPITVNGAGNTVVTPIVETPPKAPLRPPEQALEALAWLQTFHAEQGPELTDPAPGWTIVSERAGTVVRKKIIPKVSEGLPVYRGDKIVQGLTADEIASIVSTVGCRKSWDERVDAATPLSTYGHGCSTFAMTTKPSFPFKGRIFHVASINAQVRVPSPSASSSTSTVLFCASASYAPDETFDLTKLNPAALSPAQILLEGWILETLDPYTSSMFTIPSTRCTYVSCVDQSGSVPLAQSVLNANLARVITAVETLGKAKGPLPRLFHPDSGVQIEGPLSEDGDQECVWTLGTDSSKSLHLVSDFNVEDGSFRSSFKVSASSPLSHLSARGVLAPSLPVGSILKSELPRSVSLNFGPQPSGLSLQKPAHELTKKPSINSLRNDVKRSTSPTKGGDKSSTGEDIVVAEFIVDLKQFPGGYSISTSCSLIDDPLDVLHIDAPAGLNAKQVPLVATAHTAPLPATISASLDSWKRHNHLVRVLIPTAEITHPLQDPLRDSKTRAPLPDWYRKISQNGAIVQIRIAPSVPKDPKNTSAPTVVFNSEHIALQSQKDSKTVLTRLEDEDGVLTATKISRVPRKKKLSSSFLDFPGSKLPFTFQQPLGIASRLLTPKPSTTTHDDEFPDPKSPRSVTPNTEEIKELLASGEITPAIAKSIHREHASSDASNGGPLLGILGAYPLSRLTTAITSTSTTDGQGVTHQHKQMYSFSFVLVVALISFLLGSLLRSLLTPADYIIYGPPKSASQQVERALMQAFEPNRRWREARRLLELRSFFFSHWDLIVAVVRRE